VFAGRTRKHGAGGTYFAGQPPTSPQVALLKDGQLVYLMQRHQIEDATRRDRADLVRAFDQHCG